ncbi:MAG: geranylgeranyl reductase [Planctomycetaceae bacterium]|nr:geranylgeranyl reductase [Planctomycetaceae bacterium]
MLVSPASGVTGAYRKGTIMETCDVLIIGGGPAGSSCAWKLRQSGLNVVILDKAQFPRHKVCAGWITPPVLDELQIDVADYAQQAVIQPITRFLTGMIGGREVETTYAETVSYGIRRFEFDNYLLRRSGAKLKLGEPFRTIRGEGSDWVVNESIRSPLVIGAGGHFCPVARHYSTTSDTAPGTADASKPAARQQAELPVVVAQEIEFEMTAAQSERCTVLPDRPELLFCPDLKGYGWIFRKRDWLNIGLGREQEGHLSSHVAAFVAALQSQGKIPEDLPGPFHGHAYKLRTSIPRPSTPTGILLIGDSAGLADSNSGEGIRPAIESGLLAAATILELGGQNVANLTSIYGEKLRGRFTDSVSALGGISGCLPQFARQYAASWLMTSRWFSRQVLLDRWFLHAEVPALRV